MNITIWGAEIRLDLGMPEDLISEFRLRFKRLFGRKVGVWDYPPERVDTAGKAVYSCLGAEQAGHHVSVEINSSEIKRFRRFLNRFCEKHNINLSSLNLSILNS